MHRVVAAQLKHADATRQVRLSADLKLLPTDRRRGEPLPVSDKVAFTG